MKKTIAKELVFSLSHEGCFGCETTDRFPEVGMSRIGQSIQPGKKVILLQKISEFSEDHFKMLKNHKKIITAEVLKRDDTNALIKLEVKPSTTIWEQINPECVIVGNQLTKSGRERWKIVGNGKKLREVVSKLQELGNAKVEKISDICLKDDANSLFQRLSKGQKEALLLAVSKGYYTLPRKITLDELAKVLGIKRPAFRERLRKAERKIIEEIAKTQINSNLLR